MKEYIGDGIYVNLDGNQLYLTTENGIEVTNTIVFEAREFIALLKYLRNNNVQIDEWVKDSAL